MKIMWLCGSVPDEVCDRFSIPPLKPESWIKGIHEELRNNAEISIVYLLPERLSDKKIDWVCDNTHYISYPETKPGLEPAVFDFFVALLNREKPDCVHIFGTEGARTLSMLRAGEATGYIDKMVIHIQGLVSVCARHYTLGLPESVIHQYTLRDFIRHNNIYQAQKRFMELGRLEIASIQKVKHVMGRTDWDYACTTQINPQVEYHYCGEMLRKAFFHNRWNLRDCERHSIFVSQSGYPIKGFHLMLEAMREIVKRYPDAHLYTTGLNPLKENIKGKLLQGNYRRYIGQLIQKYGLENNVTYLGFLNEEDMCNRFCKSHVFVNCSSIENSPNSVGEAMVLGMPVVSSDVGGIKSMMMHDRDGLLYQADAPYMLAYSVERIFENDNLALRLANSAHEVALKRFDPSQVMSDLMIMYNKIAKRF